MAVSPIFGGNCEGETPLPIPNRAVKPLSADGTWDSRPWESRSPPCLLREPPAGRLSSFPVRVRGPENLTPSNTLRDGMERTLTAARGQQRALAWIETLAQEIGPRRPTSRAERVAAEWLRNELAVSGLDPRLEEVRAYSTFAWPQLAVLGLGCGAGLIPRRFGRLRATLAGAAIVLGALEDDYRLRPLSRLLARSPSQNLVATVEPRGPVERTLCLVSHIDTSRSGRLFDPAVAPRLRALAKASSIALAVQGAEPLVARSRPGAHAVRAARSLLGLGVALLLERELRGVDVPGANDNASGTAVTAALAAEIVGDPLETTRLVLLVTGAEEAGTLGADAFLRAHDTREWLFLNLDGVSAPATLRYLPYEGISRTWAADAPLIGLAERLRERRPELGLEPMDVPAGLTYDATPVLARGGRALTISAQDAGRIPNYHRPSDDLSNVDDDAVGRALEVGRELIAGIDGGEAD
jgi:hypothetical protein